MTEYLAIGLGAIVALAVLVGIIRFFYALTDNGRNEERMHKMGMFLLVGAFLTLSLSGCGQKEVEAAISESFTAEEAKAYWEADAVKKACREDAIRHNEVVVDWRGDWDSNSKLALFVGLTHQSDVKVFAETLDLVERDQTVLKEYSEDDRAWNTIINIPNNLQPGGKIVFNR